MAKRGRPVGGKNTHHKPPGKYLVLYIRSDLAEQARRHNVDIRAIAYKAIREALQETADVYVWAKTEEALLGAGL